MSSAEPPSDPPVDNAVDKAADLEAPSTSEAAMDTTPDAPAEETWADIPEDVLALPTEDIMTRTRLIENDMKVRLAHRPDFSLLTVGTGYAVGEHAITARAERYEGEDS